MPYFNTNNFELAEKFSKYIDTKMLQKRRYTCAKFTIRIVPEFIAKNGKYCVAINIGQCDALELVPINGTRFTDEEVATLLADSRKET